MGWWGKPYYSCPNGKDRIQAVIEDEHLVSENDEYKWDVLGTSLHGTVVYAVNRRTNKATGREDVWATVYLTRWDPNGYFMIKSMSEDMGPFYYGCPKRLLDMLPPTDNQSAVEWRQRCADRRDERKNEVRTLPIGTNIRLKNYRQPGEWIVTVCKYRGRRSYIDWNHRVRFYPRHLTAYGWEIIA